ncbi:MAG: hypothetical protein D6E12_18345 [Desulfovibrio sp.]|nr:MAG: hypothetical protein D6E12_18345 [Desulfovibrio sp.]
MADCELIAKCIFFNDKMAQMPKAAELLKDRYCRGDNSECARFAVFKAKGREAVPPDLGPSQMDRARQVIRG